MAIALEAGSVATLELGGGSLYVLELGLKIGPALVLLHKRKSKTLYRRQADPLHLKTARTLLSLHPFYSCILDSQHHCMKFGDWFVQYFVSCLSATVVFSTLTIIE